MHSRWFVDLLLGWSSRWRTSIRRSPAPVSSSATNFPLLSPFYLQLREPSHRWFGPPSYFQNIEGLTDYFFSPIHLVGALNKGCWYGPVVLGDTTSYRIEDLQLFWSKLTQFLRGGHHQRFSPVSVLVKRLIPSISRVEERDVLRELVPE